MESGNHIEQTHAGWESPVEPVWWVSVLNLLNVYSSALQSVIRIKRWDAQWCWGIHLSFVMPGTDSTALNIELGLDNSLTPFPMNLCSSDPFHSGSWETWCVEVPE
jgi:hypothetical protein